jgi:hypothetical protein
MDEEGDFEGARGPAWDPIRTPGDLVDLATYRTRAYAEYMGDDRGWPDEDSPYKPVASDLEVWIEPKEGSPLHDGWFAFYRHAGDTWLMIAGD